MLKFVLVIAVVIVLIIMALQYLMIAAAILIGFIVGLVITKFMSPLIGIPVGFIVMALLLGGARIKASSKS